MLKRPLAAAVAAVALVFVLADSALAASVSIQLPQTPIAGKPVEVGYSGVADLPGTATIDGTGANATLRTFYERNLATCAGTSAEQKARPNSKFDGNQFIETPAASYSFTSKITFADPGSYTFCAYLEVGLSGDTAPPVAAAQSTMLVTATPIPCTVPKVIGLSLASATAKLQKNGCALGKVTKPRGVKASKLVVKSQGTEPTVVLATGFKVNLTMKTKAKKKKR